MDDLFQIIIFAAILLLGLLSGRKKKKQAPQRPRAPRPEPRRQQRAAERVEPALSTRAQSPTRPAPPARERTTLEKTLFDLLQQHLPEPPPPEPVALPVEAAPAQEARSLEALEIDGGERHARFHERYVEPLVEAEGPPTRGGRRRAVVLDPKTLREAVIWQTVLGKPKGLDI